MFGGPNGQASPVRSWHSGDLHDSPYGGRGGRRRAAETSAGDFPAAAQKYGNRRVSNNDGKRRTRTVAVFRSATDDRRQYELFELSPAGVLRDGCATKTNGCQATSASAAFPDQPQFRNEFCHSLARRPDEPRGSGIPGAHLADHIRSARRESCHRSPGTHPGLCAAVQGGVPRRNTTDDLAEHRHSGRRLRAHIGDTIALRCLSRRQSGGVASHRKGRLEKFINTGCVACHSGVGVGGGMYQKFGVVEDYWNATGSDPVDKGRFDVTKDPDDLYVFRVASLRNVAMTPPYFHDGSVVRLPDAVKVMARVQLGVSLNDAAPAT